MSALAVTVLDAAPSAQTAAPAIVFRLRLENISSLRVHALGLRCHVQIDPRSRKHSPDEQARLYELFGSAQQWDRALQPVTWAHTSTVVPSFDRQIEIDLAVPCTYDLEVASAKYLHAIRTGVVPLAFAFSGTSFSLTDRSTLTIQPVPWDVDASFQMPATVWRAAMDQFFPGGGWLRLQRETIDRLQAFRGEQAVVSWDEAIALLLSGRRAERAKVDL
jgi:hypothetical protein